MSDDALKALMYFVAYMGMAYAFCVLLWLIVR